MLVVLAGLVVAGGTITVTQFASAEEGENSTAACAETAEAGTLRGGDHGDHRGRPRPGRPASPAPSADPTPGAPTPDDAGATAGPEDCEGGQGGGQNEEGGGQDQGGGQNQQPPANNGLDVLGQNCERSRLQPHDGFQNAPRCVDTAFGEVSAAGRNPSLLITNAPSRVRVNAAFQLRISTRNLVRDRFLGAGAGGYYLESSFLNDQGIQRGHVHVACRMLGSTRVAPDPEPAPAFFRAVEDGAGGAAPDQFVVEVAGLPATGNAQCAVWAGDGSHRLPMMQRANQTPAFDMVRIRVTR